MTKGKRPSLFELASLGEARTDRRTPSLFDPITIGEAGSKPRWLVVQVLMGITGQPLDALCRRLGIETDLGDLEKLVSIGMRLAKEEDEFRAPKKRGRRSLEESGEESIDVRRARAVAEFAGDYPTAPRTQTNWIKELMRLANDTWSAPLLNECGIRPTDFQGEVSSIVSSVSAGLRELERRGEKIPPNLFRKKRKAINPK